MVIRAFTSLEYALDHPDQIHTLTLIEPPTMWILRQTGKFDAEAQQKAAFFQSFHEDITEDMLAAFLLHAGLVPPGQEPRRTPQWNNWVLYRQSLRNNPIVVSFDDTLERLKKNRPLVLLVKGAGSIQWLHRVIDRLLEIIPHSKVVEFPGGDAPQIVSKDRFLEEWEKFQKTVTVTSGIKVGNMSGHCTTIFKKVF